MRTPLLGAVILGAAGCWAGCRASPGPRQALLPEVVEPAPPVSSTATTRGFEPLVVPTLAPCSQRFSAHANASEIFDWREDESAETLPPGVLLHLRFIEESMTDVGPEHERFDALILEDGRVFLHLPEGPSAVRIPRGKPACTLSEGARHRLTGMLLTSLRLHSLTPNTANPGQLLPVDESPALTIESFFDLPAKISLALAASPAPLCSAESPPLAPAPVGVDFQERLVSAHMGSRIHTLRMLNVPNYSWIFEAFAITLKGCLAERDLPSGLPGP